MSGQKHVSWLQDLDPEDTFVAGRKCMGLGGMIRDGLAIPPGFATTLVAYNKFLELTGLNKEIAAYFEKNKGKMEADLRVNDVRIFGEAEKYIGNLIETQSMPAELEEEILSFYHQLGKQCQVDDVPVAVRSSGPVSMPGQFDTFLHVEGEEALLEKIIKVWSSSYNARSMAYRLQRGMSLENSPIGIAIMKMVNARSSGVMFTLDPLNGDRSVITIEGSWGLGESLVSGQVTPDTFTLNKVTMEITKRTIGEKAIEMIGGPDGEVISVEVDEKRRNIPCITEEEIYGLGKLGKKVEAKYKLPQDIEWAVDDDLPASDNLVLLQTRPETVWNKKEIKPLYDSKKSAMDHIVSKLMAGEKIG
jgi:pyruvate,water dikinase